MNLVMQRQEYDCGHACLAMLTDNSLHNIYNTVQIQDGISEKEMLNFLSENSILFKESDLDNDNMGIYLVLLCLYKDSIPDYHWSIIKDGYLFDPSSAEILLVEQWFEKTSLHYDDAYVEKEWMLYMN